MASRQSGPGADEAPAFGSLPEPAAYAATLDRTQAGADSAARSRAPEDPPLRNPSLYAQTDHFRERLHQQGRYVSISIVNEAIRHGQLRWNTSDGWRFCLVRDGVRYTVVVSDTETASPVVVTAWTEIDCWETAAETDRWTENDIHTIRLRSELSAHHDEQIPRRIRPRIVTRPFEIGGHRVATDAGDGFVECADCGGRFRSKAGLRRRHCVR